MNQLLIYTYSYEALLGCEKPNKARFVYTSFVKSKAFIGLEPKAGKNELSKINTPSNVMENTSKDVVS
jgi:hypothetical protein